MLQDVCFMATSDGAKADYFTVLLSDNYGSTWKVAASVYGMECELDTQPFTEYMVKVITVLKLRQSTGTIVGPVAAGIDELPPDVTTLDHEELSSGTRRFGGRLSIRTRMILLALRSSIFRVIA